MKSGPYHKAPNTGSCSVQCQFLVSLLVQCAKCSRQHTVWNGGYTQVGRLTRGFVNPWNRKFVDLWIRGFVKPVKA